MTKTLLAVLAHPDDESYGIGGTLARYSAEGVDVHVAIATDGAAGSIDEAWDGDRSQLVEARYKELDAAAEVLGVKIHRLGYRDSGYIGDRANENPGAFMNADDSEAVGRFVELIQEIRPDVIITHDETGGYFHPDHIKCHQLTLAAFEIVRESQSPGVVKDQAYKPGRLYYTAFSNSWVKVVIFLMRLRGQDPSRAGRNQDIDFTKIGVSPDKITTKINYSKYWDIKREASAMHGSQGGGTSFNRLLPAWVLKRIFATETYIRVHPQLPAGKHEKDLFSEPFP
ncbi:MAG: PIG-L deacetylase family protein [Candidatus Promineifilaceae bacterium]